MPILRTDDRLIYFAHVPKCGGTSIETYLRARFGQVALVDADWWTRRGIARWSASSPQHIPVEALHTMFPPDFFDASFAVVRHPATRFVSAFKHARSERHVPRTRSLDRMLGQLERHGVDAPGLADNHFMPMTRFVPEGAEVFRMEDGLDRVAEWLDEVTGTRAAGLRIGHDNAAEDRPKDTRQSLGRRIKRAMQPAIPELDAARLERIQALYRDDYAAFGYGIAPRTAVSNAA